MTAPYDLDTKRAPQIGLIVLQTDETIERDMRVLMPDHVELLVSRVPSAPLVTSDTLAEMAGALTQAANLLPQGAHFSAVGYGCTSGTAEIGADRIAALVRQGVGAPQVTEPLSALIAACRAMGVTRLGIISPYIESVSSTLRSRLADAGLSVTAFESFEEASEERVVRISGASVAAAAVTLAKDAEIDALFLSCTNLRTLDVINDIEAATGVTVFSSNQVLAWHLLRCARLAAPETLPGRLQHQTPPDVRSAEKLPV
ncbi:MAG: aspartate/glutamate racemase family protein [Pseudomonadota bacterium]